MWSQYMNIISRPRLSARCIAQEAYPRWHWHRNISISPQWMGLTQVVQGQQNLFLIALRKTIPPLYYDESTLPLGRNYTWCVKLRQSNTL